MTTTGFTVALRRIAAALAVTAATLAGPFMVDTAAADAAYDSQIYHSSDDWDWLSAPGKIVPGGQYVNTRSGMTCSTGWIVSTEGRTFVLTAGHCGRPGDVIAISDRSGNTRRVGEFVETRHTEIGSYDDGLIELWDSAPYTSEVPVTAPLHRWDSAAQVAERRPQICRLGHRTGLSCGAYLSSDSVIVEYRNITDKGDSGGPVFAVVDGRIHAIGVSSYLNDSDATRAGAAFIEPAMNRWNLTIHG